MSDFDKAIARPGQDTRPHYRMTIMTGRAGSKNLKPSEFCRKFWNENFFSKKVSIYIGTQFAFGILSTRR